MASGAQPPQAGRVGKTRPQFAPSAAQGPPSRPRLKRIARCFFVLALAASCDRGPVVARRVIDKTGVTDLRPDVVMQHVDKMDVLVGDRLRLVGVKRPPGKAGNPRPGESATMTLYWLVERDASTTKPRVLIHAAAPGAQVNQAGADHALPSSPTEWRVGDVLVDTFAIPIPRDIAVDELAVHTGIYDGEGRWPVAGGGDRIEIGRIKIDGAPALLAKAEVKRRKSAITIDGKLDEPDWQSAARLGPFFAWDGKSRVERATHARMLWDDANLYVAFECEDPDPFTPFKHRDDPLYESEAVEIFIDADGDRDEYVELQASFNDLHFDASFVGGPRKGMARVWNAQYETKGVVDGARWISEWRIPVAQLKDVPEGEPKPGASWRINLFRLERIRKDGKVVRNEASAWSSPLSGDFHNLERFGAVTFVE